MAAARRTRPGPLARDRGGAPGDCRCVVFALTRTAAGGSARPAVAADPSPGLELDPALSPDGKLVAFVAGPLFATRLYVRQVDGGTPVAITPENGGFARMPRWSPDGQRLMFSSARGLEVMPALGGVPRLLVELPPGGWLEAAWSPDGQSIVYPSGDSVLVRAVEGGTIRGLARLPEAHSCTWSPDGRWIACVSGNRQFVTNEEFGNIASSSVWVIPATGGAPVRVTDETVAQHQPGLAPTGVVAALRVQPGRGPGHLSGNAHPLRPAGARGGPPQYRSQCGDGERIG